MSIDRWDCLMLAGCCLTLAGVALYDWRAALVGAGGGLILVALKGASRWGS